MRIQQVELLPGVSLPVLRGAAHACPYLPERLAANHYAIPFGMSAPVYEQLMNAGFRRSGDVFYRPNCPACTACRAIRVLVADFRPSRSQRRTQRRNVDLELRVAPPGRDDAHWELFCRYQQTIHAGTMLGDRDDFERFLCASPLTTFELQLRRAGRLVGVGIIDETPAALSSVYFYYEPELARRRLGVFSGLAEIELCRARGKPWWYLGFTVAGCAKMEYKQSFRPYELLGDDGVWRAAAPA